MNLLLDFLLCRQGKLLIYKILPYADSGRSHRYGLFEKPVWKPMTFEIYQSVKKAALDPLTFNKKAKDNLFDFALVHNQTLVMEQLADLKYKRAGNYESERGSIFRKYY